MRSKVLVVQLLGYLNCQRWELWVEKMNFEERWRCCAWKPLVFAEVLLSSRCHFWPNCDAVSSSRLIDLKTTVGRQFKRISLVPSSQQNRAQNGITPTVPVRSAIFFCRNHSLMTAPARTEIYRFTPLFTASMRYFDVPVEFVRKSARVSVARRDNFWSRLHYHRMLRWTSAAVHWSNWVKNDDGAAAGQLRAASRPPRTHGALLTMHLCPNLRGWRRQWDAEPSGRGPRPGPSWAWPPCVS